MRMFIHIINTWLLAQILLPFIFILFSFFLYTSGLSIGDSYFLIFIVLAFFASIPSLLIAWILHYVITNAGISLTEKFIAWMIAVAVAIFLNFSGLKLLMGADVYEEIGEILPPPIIAAITAILIRTKQFFAFQLYYEAKGNENSLL